jgi:aspartyl-tRNA(Asn)/glutamyl-tRNA(Gln) amidotransferase subunit B
VADYFEVTARHSGDAKAASNWIMTQVLSALNARSIGIAELGITAESLGELIKLVNGGTVSATAARRVFTEMQSSGGLPQQVIERLGLAQVSDDEQIRQWASEVIAQHADIVERYRAGDGKLLGFLMGELMKKSKGKADPRRANEVMRAALS